MCLERYKSGRAATRYDDRDHLVDAPPTRVDEEKVRENAARGADGDGDA